MVAVAAALTAVALAGCQLSTAGTASASPSTPAATTTPAAPAAAPAAAPTTTASPQVRRSTSGQEQMKYLCEHGQQPKADCDAFFEQARRDGVRFNP